MNQIRNQKLLATEAIKFDGHLCNKLDNLWQALYQLYNSAQDRPIDTQLFDELSSYQQVKWLLFSIAKLKDIIFKCNISSTPGSDHISWNYLKVVVDDTKCCSNIVNIANICIDISYQLTHFKKSIFIIITKPNKLFYNTPKVFFSIVLFNTLGKLIKKTISYRLQVYSITSDFIYPSQLGGIKQCSTIDAEIFLTHLI